MKVETVSRNVYIASDGKRFNDETECSKYETKLNHKSKFNALKATVDSIECIEDSYAPFGYDYVDVERYEYRWYKPKTVEEIAALNDFFNTDINLGRTDDEIIGEWVGIEIDGDYDFYSGNEDVYAISSLDDSVKQLTEFYSQLGYTVEIKKIKEETTDV